MAETKHVTFSGQCPVFCVKSVPASIEYYVDKLGFKKNWDWGDPVSFGSVIRDDVALFFCQDGQGKPGMWVSIFVDDVDASYEDYKQRGAIIRQPPTNFQWGMREMNIEDPDGHRLRIGTLSEEPSDNIGLCED